MLYTLNIGYWYAKFKRWYYSRQGVKCSLTQRQANKAFENPDFPIQTTSATLINTLWFTSFYSSVLPIGIMFSLLCFIYEYYALKVFFNLFELFYYFFKKHMVLRRSSIIHELGDELAEQMTDLVELSLFWFAVSFNFKTNI